MKKGSLVLVVCLAVMFAFSGCASTGAARVDANAQIDLTGKWNDTDVRKVSDDLLNKFFDSPAFDRYINTFQDKNRGELPTVIVGNFKNTSSEHIDTSIMSSIIRAAIINSGKLEFVEGGSAREELRAERQDQQGNASESSAAALGNETGANLMLQGTVKSIVEKQGNQTLRSYFVTASITNLETSRILWEGNNDKVKKLFTQAKAKL
jgi:uncharacterized protein (TIGR02722 family)